MCIGGTQVPQQKFAVRPDPNLTYVKGNIEDPLSDPFVQKDTSPIKVAKKSSVTQSSSNDLNISSYT
jgi:hypothetical protein|tara:strand:+ start:753 stop:953 length:201 start_codon:yes stop_codon:yes gene_type:complete